MNILKNYENYIKESRMDYTFNEPRKSVILFSDIIRKDKIRNGNKFSILHFIYDYPDDQYIGLRLINPNKVILKNEIKKYRFTQLKSTIYKDTNVNDRNSLDYDDIKTILNRKKNYYFYEMIRGNRVNGIPNKNDIVEVILNENSKPWIFIIEKNINCSLIKTLSRQEGGTYMESELSNKYGWEHSPQKIILQIKKNNSAIESGKLLSSILSSDDSDIFGIDYNLEAFSKYDLIINGNKKIEVKKIDNGESDVWKNGKSKQFILAEQCKISDNRTLKKLVIWYRDIFSFNKKSIEYKYSNMLSTMYEKDIREEFRMGSDSIYNFICDDIKEYYNARLDHIINAFSKIESDKWMRDSYGIYFAVKGSARKFDFLIKSDDNIKYEWKIVKEWAGFNRLKLFMYISGESMVHILTENNNFIEAYKLKDYYKYKDQKRIGIIEINGDIFTFNQDRNIWIKN